MKKNKLLVLVIGIGIIIVGVFIYLQWPKDYQSLPEIVEKMDISAKNIEKNTTILKKFAEKNNYSYSKQEYDGKTNILITIPYKFDLLNYDQQESSMRYARRDGTNLTESTKAKVNTIKKNESLKKVLATLGEPDVIDRKGSGWFRISWGSNEKKAVITFENKRVVEIENDN